MFSVPPPSLRGGSAVAVAMLRKRIDQQVKLIDFSFGRRTDSETLSRKLFDRMVDLFRCHSLMKRARPDVIHLNSAFDPRSILRDALFVWLTRRAGLPVFVLFHGSLEKSFAQSRTLIGPARRFLLTHATRIGVLSEAERVAFGQAFPEISSRLTVVKNIVDDQFLECTPEPAKDPSILFISRFIRAKGPFDVLQAVPKVLAMIPTAQFIFAGDGEDLDEFRRQVIALDLKQSVTVLDNVPNSETVELYRRAWMLVFPSYFPEGMPMVVAEALGSGLPLITTRIRFAESYLRESQNMLYIPQANPDAIADRIVHLINNPVLRQNMAIANRKLASALFSGTIVSAEFLRIYSDLARFPSNGHLRTKWLEY